LPVPEGVFPDALILSVLARAELHDGRDEPGIHYSFVVDHLGLVMGPSTGHKLRPRFRAMEAASLITGFKRHGSVVYKANSEGKSHAQGCGRCRVAGVAAAPRLARGPRRRREAHPGLLRRAGRAPREGTALLADDATDSEAWFAFGERLGKAYKRLGSATYCLREWAEPSDDTADIDDGPRRGRRNPRS
jgi:hypothetical protein